MFDIRLSRRQFAGLGAAVLSSAALSAPAAAQSSATQMTVTVTAQDFSFNVPAQVQGGYVDVLLKNNGKEIHQAQIAKLHEGVTFDQFKSVLEKSPDAAFPLAGFRGGPNAILPGASAETIDLLDAGTYVLICFVSGADHIPHYMKGMIAQFEVTGEGTGSTEPAPALTVTAMDFSYQMPDQVSAGKQIWELFNNGPQPHEMALMTLAPNVTAQQAIAVYEQISQPPATPAAGATPMAGMTTAGGATPMVATGGTLPFAPAGGINAIDPGIPGWMVLDLQPGNYLALCNVPDPKTGKPHFELGMYKEFTVTAAQATPVATPVT